MAHSTPTLIIAEAGVNHNGDMALARQLIDVAADAGADYVKFQTFKAGELASPTAQKAAYQKTNMGDTGEAAQLAMLEALELKPEDHHGLIAYCAERNIKFLSTAFDPSSIAYLAQLDLDYVKIPSGEITNLINLRAYAQVGKPIILSTGMATLGEVETALQVLLENGHTRESLTVLHCTTQYPAPADSLNLRAIQTLAQAFQVRVGYSDHSTGIEAPLAAVALGATVIEKHFTLNHAWKGTDHALSLEPIGMHKMVRDLHRTRVALGSPEKVCYDKEAPAIHKMSKSLYTARALPKGHVLCAEDIVAKSPGGGIPPYRVDDIIGKTLKADVDEEAPLSDDLFG